MTNIFNQILLLIFLVIIFGCYSIHLGSDSSADLTNYHIYNGWALWHYRYNIDVNAVDNLHGHFNPLLDAINYQFRLLLGNKVYAFTYGSISAISAFFCSKIIHLGLNTTLHKHNLKLWAKFWFIAITTLCAVTGYANLVQVGLSSNENIITALFIGGFYLILVTPESFTGGLLLGLALGFKLTIIPFIVAVVLWVIAQTVFIGIRKFSLLLILKHLLLNRVLIAILLGFLITGGFWASRMYFKFHNPVYPSFGNIFISPDIYKIDWIRDDKFLPSDYLHWWFLPFYLMFINKITGELLMRDYRIAFGFIALIIIMLISLYKWLRFRKVDINTKECFICFTFIIGYILWLLIFAIQRYAIVLEYLSVIILALAINKLFINYRIKLIVLLLLALVIIFSTRLSGFGHVKFGQAIDYNKQKLNISNSLIIVADSDFSYLTTMLGVTNIYMGAPNIGMDSKYSIDQKLSLISKFRSKFAQKIYLITNQPTISKQWLSSKSLAINYETCQPLFGYLNESICQLKKV